MYKDEVALFGAAYDPIANELFFDERGKGAYLNGETIKVSDVGDLKKALILFDAGTRGTHELESGEQLFQKLLGRINCMRKIGSCALEYSYIACGRADCSVYAYSDPYSFPAGKIILEEAGGRMSDEKGNEWTPETLI